MTQHGGSYNTTVYYISLDTFFTEIGHTEPYLLIIELVGGAKFLLLDLCAENYNTQRIFVASRSTYEMRPDHLLTFVFFDWKLGT